MDRLISEQAVLDAVDKTCCGSIEYRAIYDRCEERIKAIPSAEPTDVDEALRILDAINSSGRMDYGDYCELHDVISMISAEPKTGHWIPRNSFLLQYKCSECGWESEKYNYCPDCGARMEGVNNNVT